MKRKIMVLLALLMIGSLVFSTAMAFAEPAETAEESAEGSAEGESAGELAEGESEGESEGASMGESVALEAATETPSENGVVTFQMGENTVLLYYPTPNMNDEAPVNMTCTAPVFLIFGDAPFDEAAAVAYAEETGLAAIAAAEGSSVIFVNPAGDTWGEADEDAYKNTVQNISDSSTDVHKNGITSGMDPMSQEISSKITGTSQRIYVYGEGAGADYLARTALGGYEGMFGAAAGATLIGLSDASTIVDNNIPVVSIGNSDEINKILEEKCGSVVIDETADFPAEYEAVISRHRIQNNVVVPVYNWAEEGIVEKLVSYEVQTSPDHAGDYAGTETHPVGCAIYYADDLDIVEGNVPLVICCHGGGNTCLYEAQASQWPLIGKANGFITVSVDLHHPNVTATEMLELIDLLKAEYSIDETRMYLTGFSMGGCKSWDMLQEYPEVFAGLAPMDASQEVGLNSYDNPLDSYNQDILTPVFYVGGEASFAAEMPSQAQKCLDRMAYVLQVNNVGREYNVSLDQADSWEDPYWGISGDITYNVTDQKDFTDSTLHVNLFASADGKYYTAFAGASNQSHEVYARNSWAAWDFLSQFSRNPDGSITISGVTYALPADDGSITDNSYNR